MYAMLDNIPIAEAALRLGECEGIVTLTARDCITYRSIGVHSLVVSPEELYVDGFGMVHTSICPA
jgi:hypothetical protein